MSKSLSVQHFFRRGRPQHFAQCALSRLSASALLIAAAFGTSLVHAQTVNVTIGGTSYSITTTASNSYTNLAASLQATPWWGDQSKALAIATAVGGGFGKPNGGGNFGPLFAFQTYGGGTGVDNSALCTGTSICTSNGNGVTVGSNWVWAVNSGPSVSVISSITTSTGNAPAGGAARAIDANAALQPLFSGLTTDQQISNAVTQTLPLLTGGSMAAAQSALTGINRVIQARIEGNRGMSSGDSFYGDKHVWFKPFGSRADQDDRNGVSGYQANTYGLAFGVDGSVNPATRLGAAFAYAKSDVGGNSTIAPQRSDVSVYQIIAYGSYNIDDRTELNFQADLGQNTNKGRRQLAFTSTTASANYDSHTAHVGAGLGRTYSLSGQTSITPSIRADYTWIRDNAYSEQGAGLLNLNVESRTTKALILGANTKVAHQLDDAITLIANLGLGYDTMSKQAAITSAFAGAPGAAFVTYGIDPSPWLGQAGVGAIYKTKSGLEFTGRYDAEYRTSFLNQTASIKARWAF